MTRSLVIYDSAYGNTEKIARAIGEALGADGPVEVRRAGETSPEDAAAADLVVVGSPTQGFRPTKPVSVLVKRWGNSGLSGKRVAAFDTRFDVQTLRSGALKLLVKTGGYAAPHIANSLKKAGGSLVLPAEGFFVEDTEGPLRAGELERAAAWASELLKAGQAR